MSIFEHPSVQPPLRPPDDQILEAFEYLGFPHPYEQHRPVLVALRNPEQPGTFNDLVGGFGGPDRLSYWCFGTADPGRGPMEGRSNIGVNRLGVARVPAGYYPENWEAGLHHEDRRHPAFTQVRSMPLIVERWNNTTKEWWRDPTPRVGRYSWHRTDKKIDRPVMDASHGCPVVNNRRIHWHWMVLCGYPKHGVKTDEHRALRWDGAFIDWHAYLNARALGIPRNPSRAA